MNNLVKNNIEYNHNLWISEDATFYLIDEDYCLKNKINMRYFINEDLLQFKHKNNNIIVDVGVYGEKAFDVPFVGYTISVIQEKLGWGEPIEKMLIKKSTELKNIVEELLHKYS